MSVMTAEGERSRILTAGWANLALGTAVSAARSTGARARTHRIAQRGAIIQRCGERACEGVPGAGRINDGDGGRLDVDERIAVHRDGAARAECHYRLHAERLAHVCNE